MPRKISYGIFAGGVPGDPSLAGVRRTVRELMPGETPELAVVQADDTVVEVAALMARSRTPPVAVLIPLVLITALASAFLDNLVPLVIIEITVPAVLLPWLFRGVFTHDPERAAEIMALKRAGGDP